MGSYQADIVCLKSQLTNGSSCHVEQTGRQEHTGDVCISTSHLDSLLQSVVRNRYHYCMSHFTSFKRLISPDMNCFLETAISLYPPQRRLGWLFQLQPDTLISSIVQRNKPRSLNLKWRQQHLHGILLLWKNKTGLIALQTREKGISSTHHLCFKLTGPEIRTQKVTKFEKKIRGDCYCWSCYEE